jgi:phospholipid/cholesterol/gamma-HCH transport system permease protein
MSAAAPLRGSLGRLGDAVIEIVEELGAFARLAGATARAAFRARPPVIETLRQMEAIGVRSTTIVAVTALFTGMVMSLQTAFALSRFGAKPYVGGIVGLALVRELAPVLAALMVTGRVGAGITAEIGSMVVTEQVDAIRAMGADPVQKLVLPRVVAATLSLPLLTVLAVVLGILGGMAIADVQYGITPRFYMRTVTYAVVLQDLLSGLAKTFAFGWIIGTVGCFMGLRATGGTTGVGRATTRSVVTASITVLISDFFLTKVLLAL